MARPNPLLLGLILLAPTAWADLVVEVEPKNRAVKDNIEAYIGPVEAQSPDELRRLFEHADKQATRAAQALGYYHSSNYLAVSGSEQDPTLTIKVDLGTPVRINAIDIDIQGEGRAPMHLRLACLTVWRLESGSIMTTTKALSRRSATEHCDTVIFPGSTSSTS